MISPTGSFSSSSASEVMLSTSALSVSGARLKMPAPGKTGGPTTRDVAEPEFGASSPSRRAQVRRPAISTTRTAKSEMVRTKFGGKVSMDDAAGSFILISGRPVLTCADWLGICGSVGASSSNRSGRVGSGWGLSSIRRSTAAVPSTSVAEYAGRAAGVIRMPSKPSGSS